MKRLIVVYSLSAASTLLLAGCGKDECKVTATVEQEGMTPVTIKKTDSGLQYEIINPGSGESPKARHSVTVHYTGWLDNNGQPGTKFDSSVDRGQPFTFKIGVGQVIKGWDEGVMGMKVGEKRRLIIPATLGYGARGAGNLIPPNATLIFDVELLNVD